MIGAGKLLRMRRFTAAVNCGAKRTPKVREQKSTTWYVIEPQHIYSYVELINPPDWASRGSHLAYVYSKEAAEKTLAYRRATTGLSGTIRPATPSEILSAKGAGRIIA